MLYISKFIIKSLNDVYTYSECVVNSSSLDTVIIYGDNGSGKTTILNLIFHLLSSADAKGHLTAISKVPFQLLSVELSDGTVVSAERQTLGDNVPVHFSITRQKKLIANYTYLPSGYRERFFQEHFEKQYARARKSNRVVKIDDNSIQLVIEKEFISRTNEGSHEKYISALKKLNFTCYLITTDRSVKCDELENQKGNLLAFKSDSGSDRNIVADVRSTILQDAINKASRYVNKKIIESSKDGSQDTNQIFIQLISKVANSLPGKNSSLLTGDEDFDPRSQFVKIKKENNRFLRYGILPEIESDELVSFYENSNNEQKNVLLKLINSYTETIKARHKALDSIANTIEIFLKSLNKLLNHKEIKFSPANGFTIKGLRGELLQANQLSSGEQQLLLMFCYLLASNEHNAIFMIDEPEISLNVKWQRTLIDAMRDISKHSNKQLVVATHSIELLTQYMDSVVPLNPEVSTNRRQNYEHPTKND